MSKTTRGIPNQGQAGQPDVGLVEKAPEKSPHQGQALAALTAIYLVIPGVLFAWGWLRWPYAVITTVLISVFIFIAGRDAWRAWNDSQTRVAARTALKALWPALLLLAGWVACSGIGGFGQQSGDYKSHNALLSNMITEPWPVRILFEGVQANIVYYVGYYLPAAAIGKVFGWGTANVFMLLWGFLGASLAFLWFWRVSGVWARWGALLSLALVFCLASGMDVIGYYLYKSNPFVWGKHIEHWAKFIQFSSQTTLLYWVPQQVLAAWLIAGMTFAGLQDARLFRYLGMAVGASILWSPFGVIGIAPFLLVAGLAQVLRKQARTLFQPLSLAMNVASLWVGGIHLLYISSNQLDFPIGLLWNLVKDRRDYILTAFVFWTLELGLFVILAAVLRQAIRRAGRVPETALGQDIQGQWVFLLVATLFLSILPLFKMGYSNDLVMRGSIPALFFLWAFAGRAWIDAWPHLRKKAVSIPFTLLTLILLTGSYTSLSEIQRSIRSYHFGPPDIANVLTITTATDPHIVAQRIGQEDTFFYAHLGR